MTNDKGAPKPEEIEYIPVEPPEAEKPQPPAGPPETAAVAPKEVGEAPKPESDDGAHLKGKLKKRDAEIKSLKKDKEDLRDQYLRCLADMDNLRKRLDREKSDFLSFALSDLLLEMLGVLDNFERALDNTDQGPDGKSFREGVELIYRMFQNLLYKKGVQPIAIQDRKFDPNLHHAMITEEAEGIEEPEVKEELQKGYMLHNRLLRPTLVKVAVPKKTE
jgi:molecular chaperone GrpE